MCFALERGSNSSHFIAFSLFETIRIPAIDGCVCEAERGPLALSRTVPPGARGYVGQGVASFWRLAPAGHGIMLDEPQYAYARVCQRRNVCRVVRCPGRI